ncbi:PP2C family protein-serine/threonine phosphatase [Cohnella lupini]|uniref:Sigma-B regulation protein RsbU (Phosphoserine phosphatase) n=1 Tax=Cohnella lupini TaxID=1294267 RepID=A0A3D9I4S8_9BACL|nr:fused response regulator/phosphatase [Cohnella lupini]RED56767.1 sigma-B regulation protein RsbU (phosphoserine phosphatase) [Cohnella lupini]
MTVLIVDDNAMNVMVIQEMLKRAGYDDFRVAYSAEEMFELLNNHGEGNAIATPNIDLILLDLMMPAMDGIEACRRLQANIRFKDIPVIMVTAIGDSRKLAEALDAGAIDFVTKPINKTELLARIRSALKLKRELDWHKERDSRMRQELLLARQVQESVLPDKIEESNLRIKAYFQASEELAGDLYAWHKIDDNRWAIAVIDAMGHGISSSLVSMFIASILKESMRTLWSPDKVFAEINRRLMGLQWENELVHYYCTGIYVTLDLERRTLEYANAGHPAGLLYNAEASLPERLSVSSAPLGMFDSMEIVSRSISLSPGDSLYLFTDGILSPFQGDDETQLEQLASFLHQAREDEASIEQLIVIKPLDGRSDDRCLVKVEVIPRGAKP